MFFFPLSWEAEICSIENIDTSHRNCLRLPQINQAFCEKSIKFTGTILWNGINDKVKGSVNVTQFGPAYKLYHSKLFLNYILFTTLNFVHSVLAIDFGGCLNPQFNFWPPIGGRLLRVLPVAVSTCHSWLWQTWDDVYTRSCFSEFEGTHFSAPGQKALPTMNEFTLLWIFA